MNEITDGTTGDWRKASASTGSGGCVEFRRHRGHIQMRDSKLGEESPVLTFTPHEIRCLLDGTANSEFADLLD